MPQQPAPTTVAVVINPTKVEDLDATRRTIEGICRRKGAGTVLWEETTEDDPGSGQARKVVEDGAELVLALGGDGTVRAVGAALAGTRVPMGLLPGGTGNLLARNLELPVDSLERALIVALSGRDHPIDTALLELVRPTTQDLVDKIEDDTDPALHVDLDDGVDDRESEEVREEHRFLVMAGLGFDAEVMASVEERLKRRLGWVAYLVAGLKHLKGPQFMLHLQIDDRAPMRRRVRGFVVGNVGKLQGGMELLPGAEEDDGTLDAVMLSPEGVVGWGAALAQLVTRRRIGHKRVDHEHGARIRVVSDKAVELELDGDPIGPVTAMQVQVEPGALLVRVPRTRQRSRFATSTGYGIGPRPTGSVPLR